MTMFWLIGVIYFAALMALLAPPPEETPPPVVDYEGLLKAELRALYQERARRVTQAFSAPLLTANAQLPEVQPAFTRWVALLSEGQVRVGDRLFSPDEMFEQVVRDERNVKRAVVSSNGDGTIWITSQGILYGACWTQAGWQVKEIQARQIS